MDLFIYVIYILLFVWFSYSIYMCKIVYEKGFSSESKVVTEIFYAIPRVFTSLGVLGTFFGIFVGLLKFDVVQIEKSIPSLLDGLKTAFSTSLIGIFCSIVFGLLIDYIESIADKRFGKESTSELSALIEINNSLNDGFLKLKESIIGEADDTISTQLIKMRTQFSDDQSDLKSYHKNLIQEISNVNHSLGGSNETSLLTQIQKSRTDQKDLFYKNIEAINFISDSVNKNHITISDKFEGFKDILAKNNTEALVDVMKKVTDSFNHQMSKLIEKLVQENFQELNNSVKKMNDWQVDNKEMVSTLTQNFKEVSKDFKSASTSINEITENTSKLTNKNSDLSHLIIELQKVMIDDNKYQEIVTKLSDSVHNISNQTKEYEKTSFQLSETIKSQINFSDSVKKLLLRLENIDKIKDINESFWKNTEKQLNDGVGIISKSSHQLSRDVESINAEFYQRLGSTFTSLDNLIARVIKKHSPNN